MSLAEGLEGRTRASGLKRARGLFSVLSLAAALCILGGCGDTGFRPLYGSAGLGGAATQEKLATVDIAPIPGRVGQRIRNELIFQATGGGLPAPPQYRLDIAIRESVISTLVRVDGNAGGQIINIEASYNLIKLSDKSVISSGKSFGRASFDRVTSIFANVEARQDAEDRAAESVGEELRTRLLAILSTTA
jgi:LPS-assembly lipoprotein